MTIRVSFDGGPLHGQIGHVENLPQLQLFFDQRQRHVFCYKRTDEVTYSYDQEISDVLTKGYDEAFQKFGATAQSVVSWGKNKPRLTKG